VIASCGATLVEVGTTNKTRAADFERAITERTGALLSVHQSNFAVLGFTQRASREELARIAVARGVPLLEDLGSGALIDLAQWGLPHEPTAREAIAGGADVVMFSGDKLLGGPQAGILVGRAAWIDRLRKHPLMRALRPGRIVLAALEATLARYASGRASSELPAVRALCEPVEIVRARAERLLAAVHERTAAPSLSLSPSIARVGGGTLPLAEIPSAALALAPHPSCAPLTRIERALRTECEPPVIARIAEDCLWLDARTLADDDVALVAAALARALAQPHRTDDTNTPARLLPRHEEQDEPRDG
jgi:L-seryl-tRNA(Ser) seleniumtransferase